MLSYVIVGSGYRAEYFGRIARTYPDLFRALFLCRSREKAERMTLHTGVPAAVSLDECLAFRPDFAVIAVDRGHVADVAEEWLRRGLPVVTETPVADTAEKLDRMWQWGQKGAKIVCCEQYPRQPLLAAGLRAVDEGRIGTPSSVYISLLHDYHAAAMIRRCLGIHAGEGFTVRGVTFQNPVTETDSRYGAFRDGRMARSERTIMDISFSSGKEALYDFSPVQYRSYIRSRHITVRGDRGEWSDAQLLFLDDRNIPCRQALIPDIPERYLGLDTQALRDRRRNWTAELAPDTVQDEYAVATVLLDMEEYLAGGPSPYPLREALEDGYFWHLFRQAAEHPWQEVRSECMPWHDREER